MPERLEGHRENGSTSAHASLGGRKCTEIQQSHRNTTTWERILQTMAQTGKMCLCARLTLDSSKSTPEVLPAAEAVSMWIHSIPSYPVPAFICSVYLSFFHCELLKPLELLVLRPLDSAWTNTTSFPGPPACRGQIVGRLNLHDHQELLSARS
nr:uncharacterized protein LOC123285185 isoform X6 [Equus asinus]